jgi:hypothetical protein
MLTAVKNPLMSILLIFPADPGMTEYPSITDARTLNLQLVFISTYTIIVIGSVAFVLWYVIVISDVYLKPVFHFNHNVPYRIANCFVLRSLVLPESSQLKGIRYVSVRFKRKKALVRS